MRPLRWLLRHVWPRNAEPSTGGDPTLHLPASHPDAVDILMGRLERPVLHCALDDGIHAIHYPARNLADERAAVMEEVFLDKYVGPAWACTRLQEGLAIWDGPETAEDNLPALLIAGGLTTGPLRVRGSALIAAIDDTGAMAPLTRDQLQTLIDKAHDADQAAVQWLPKSAGSTGTE